MQPLKARVQHGRLVLDEPTDRPDGEIVYLVALDEGDDLDTEERARLEDSLERSAVQARAGQVIDADEVIRRLMSRT
jgi:hypothetical protein